MRRVIFFILVMILIVFKGSPLYSAEETRLGETINQRLKSQFFCGYCHVLTYPKVIKKAHESWKRDEKHKNVSCAECHYPPERLDIKIREHERIPTTEKAALKKKTEWEFMKTELEVLSRLITIVNMEESTVRTKPRIDDRSCTTSKCHPTTGKGKEGEYWVKKLKFTEYERPDKTKAIVPFTHKAHYDKEKWVKGHELHCSTCHRRQSEQKHFDVSKESCFLCHFKNLELNEKRSKCSLCHEVPEKPLQKQFIELKIEVKLEEKEKPITHKSLEEAKVPCASCHAELVHGSGDVKEKECLECHERGKALEALKKENKKEIMHKSHVATQAADCFECHTVIQHKKVDFLDVARLNCKACHPDHHTYQKIIMAGEKRKGVSKTPALMFDVKTTCLGCHKEEKVIKGDMVVHGSAKTCAACHTERQEKMVKAWKEKIDEELKYAKGLEKEASEVIAKAEGRVSKEKLEKAKEMLKEGQESMRIVEYGGGVHNQKYSIMLLDIAMNNFEDLIDYLKNDNNLLSKGMIK